MRRTVVVSLAALLFGAGQSRPASGPAKELPEGPGLAAVYPGDKGIATSRAVIYASDFEDGIKAPLRAARRGVSIVHDAKLARSGTAAARIVATRGQDEGGDLAIQWEQGVEQVFVRVYVRFDKDTAMPHHFINIGGNTPTYKFRQGGGAGQRPTGDENGAFNTTLEPPKAADGTWHFYTYWHEMRSWQTPEGKPDGRPNPFYGNNFRYPKQTPKIERDKWICVEYMIRLNTIGNRDGEMAFWIDGKNFGHWRPGSPVGRWLRENFYTQGPYFEQYAKPHPFEGFSWRTAPTLKINRAMLQWYLSDRTYSDTKVDKHIVYFDNLVVATSYIGPTADNANSKAPPRPQVRPPRPGAKSKCLSVSCSHERSPSRKLKGL